MLFIDMRTPRASKSRYQEALFNVANMDTNGAIESVHINGVSVPRGVGGDTPLKGLNGDVQPARVCFSGFLS